MSEGRWIRVCRAEEIAPGKSRVVATAAGAIAVFRAEDGRLFAIEDRCPHRGGRLSGGAVYDNDKVACPDHGWTICLSNGRVEPPDSGQVRTYPVAVADGEVRVQM
jgi:nitrite reductase (NADH) small subunit